MGGTSVTWKKAERYAEGYAECYMEGYVEGYAGCCAGCYADRYAEGYVEHYETLMHFIILGSEPGHCQNLDEIHLGKT
ncbi:unnamed protein product [Lota lota]